MPDNKTSRFSFFARPLRVLIEIFDPSNATSARPRKLGDKIIFVHQSLSPLGEGPGERPQTPCTRAVALEPV